MCTRCRKDLAISWRLKPQLGANCQASWGRGRKTLLNPNMRRNKLALYVHLVWATWNRLPLITPNIERMVYRVTGQEVVKYGCEVVAINGTDDHVHLLVTLPTTIDIATLVKQAKGVSSHAINDTMQLSTPFKWQGSYGAYTVSRWDVDRVVAYIKRQKEHHAAGELVSEFEMTFEE